MVVATACRRLFDEPMDTVQLEVQVNDHADRGSVGGNVDQNAAHADPDVIPTVIDVVVHMDDVVAGGGLFDEPVDRQPVPDQGRFQLIRTAIDEPVDRQPVPGDQGRFQLSIRAAISYILSTECYFLYE